MNSRNNKDVDTIALHLEYLFEKNVNFKDRIITVAEDITAELFLKLDAALTEMESHNRKAVTIRIMSEGGHVDAAVAIVGRIRSSKCKIITEGYGYIQSSATLILASGHHRRISEYAEFMHHESRYGLADTDATQSAFKHSEIKEKWLVEEKLEDRWAVYMATFSKKSKRFWREKGTDKDAWFSPKELIKMGVVDEIF